MNSSPSFQINTPTVVHEIFDEEVVVIHLESGNYYTLDQDGARLWQLLNQGLNAPAITATVAETSPLTAAEILAIVEHFITTLQQEDLIVPAVEPNPITLTLPPLPLTKQNQPFQTPVIRKYTDMQDLLLLDPIHDVDETGWPNAQRA